jgi:hypothetical protein
LQDIRVYLIDEKKDRYYFWLRKDVYEFKGITGIKILLWKKKNFNTDIDLNYEIDLKS